MLTIRQIERLYSDNDFPRLARELLNGRVEFSLQTLADYSTRLHCAAMGLIRIAEFGQSYHPVNSAFIRTLLAAQNPDGSWGENGGDAPTTALVLRALSTSRGYGLAIDNGVTYLTNLQRDDGLFPKVPIRRTQGDEFTTALTLHHLASVPVARGRMRELTATSVVNLVAETSSEAASKAASRNSNAKGGAAKGSAKASTSEVVLSTRRLLRTLSSVPGNTRGPIPKLPAKTPVHTKLAEDQPTQSAA